MQKHPLAAYFSKLSIFAICVCFVYLFAALALPKEFFSQNIPYYVIMFYALTALSYLALYFLPRKRKVNFVHIFLISKLLKFLIYIGVLALVYLFGVETQAKFAVSYFILFLLFLVFDTVTTNRLSRKEAEREKEEAKQQSKANDNE